MEVMMMAKIRMALQVVVALAFCLSLLGSSIAVADPGDLTRVSMLGDPGDLKETPYDTEEPSISGDGRYVAFQYDVPSSPNHYVYVHDRQLFSTTLVDVEESIEYYHHRTPDISADGKWVAFERQIEGYYGIYIMEWQTSLDIIIIDPPSETLNDPGLYNPSISGNGCRVAYEFTGSKDTVLHRDIYVFDCDLEDSVLVSKTFDSTIGDPVLGDGESYAPSISDDGRYVAFESLATNLLDEPVTDGLRHVYVRDLLASTTEIIPFPVTGTPEGAYVPSISADGRYVAYAFGYYEDEEDFYEIYVYDRQSGDTTLVSEIDGKLSGEADRPSISGDGRFVAFQAILEVDTNNFFTDIYVHDLLMNKTTLVTRGVDGDPDEASEKPAFSADGRFVTFHTYDDLLLAGDTDTAIDVYVYENDVTTQFYIFLPLILR
jgi:Tol biopolymer transport system component